MKLLLIHADHVWWKAREPALRSAPPTTAENAEARVEEALVVFYSVEKADEGASDEMVSLSIANVADVLRQVKAPHVVLYPYAHLSNQLASPGKAVAIGNAMLAAAQKEGWNVRAAPFGYYKAFELRAKGHPLAELSRTLTPGMAPPAAGKAPSH